VKSTRSPITVSIGSFFTRAGEYNGVHLLGVFTHGPGQMFNTKRPIKSLTDLQGMKIRTGGGIAEAMARALGASAFVKPRARVLRAAQLGDRRRRVLPAGIDRLVQARQLVKYGDAVPGGFYSSSFGFFINEDKWSKLAQADQDLIGKFGGDISRGVPGKSWDNVDRVGNEGNEESGRADRPGEPALVKEIQSKAQPVIQGLGQGRERQAQHRRCHGAARVPRGTEARCRRKISATRGRNGSTPRSAVAARRSCLR